MSKKLTKTEEEALASKQVLLWGLNKVSTKLMKKAEEEFKPTKRAYKKKEGVVEKVKVDQYDPDNEDYDEKDLDFLNKEYKRISDLPSTDENLDLQDKLYDVIEQIESIAEYKKKIGGNGLEKSTGWINKGSKPINIGKEVYGGSVKVKHVKRFIESSYSDKPENDIDQYIMDKDLSNEYAKTYNDPKTGQTVIVHRGTAGASDWGNNLAYTGGVYKMTDRYKNAKKLQDKVNDKYGKENVSTLGHSQGAILARELGKGGKEVISLNPAFMAESEGKNEHTIRSGSDAVSGMKGLKGMIFGKDKNTTTIKSKNPFDVLGEHSSDILDRMDQEEMIGNGLNKIMGGAITKGSPEALARAEKMRLGKEAKRIALGKPEPKGKYVKKVKEEKPYYNIGDIPNGYREATEEEALMNDKVSNWGKYQVSEKNIKEFKNVGFLFNKNLSEDESKHLISRMITRMKGSIRDIPFVNNRLENIHEKGKDSKYFKNKAEIEEEGYQLKIRYKTASKMIDILTNHIKSINPSFKGVIKPKPEAKDMKIDKVEEYEHKDWEVPKPSVDTRVYTKIKEPKETKKQLMDTFTHMTKKGKKVDINTKVNILQDKIHPKIKTAMRENLLTEFDKEMLGHGLNKEYKNISSSNTYNNMDHNDLIRHHTQGLTMALHKAGIRGGDIGGFFRSMGNDIKHVAEHAGSETEHFGERTLPSYLIHTGIPAVTSALGGAGGEVLGGPLGGIIGATAGKEAGNALANYTGDKTGYGIKGFKGKGMSDYLTHGIIGMPEGGGYLTHGLGGGIKGYPKFDGKKSPYDGEWNRKEIDSPSMRIGRGFKKGSAEAKAWGAKMKEARNKKA